MSSQFSRFNHQRVNPSQPTFMKNIPLPRLRNFFRTAWWLLNSTSCENRSAQRKRDRNQKNWFPIESNIRWHKKFEYVWIPFETKQTLSPKQGSQKPVQFSCISMYLSQYACSLSPHDLQPREYHLNIGEGGMLEPNCWRMNQQYLEESYILGVYMPPYHPFQ